MSLFIKKTEVSNSGDSENIFPKLRYVILLDCRIKTLQKLLTGLLSLGSSKVLEISLSLVVPSQLFLNINF